MTSLLGDIFNGVPRLLITRVWMVVRFSVWVLMRIVDAVTTVISIIYPIVSLSIRLLAAFTNFMGGLLTAEIRVEFSILFPAIVIIGSWLLWVFFPFLGCLFQNTILPFITDAIPLYTKIFLFILTVFNLLVKVWNAIVPIIGLIINIIVELFVIFFTLLVSIMGSAEVFKVMDAIFTIMTAIVSIVIEILESLIGLTPTLISTFADICGALVSAVLELAPMLFPIVTWLTRTLFNVLEPVLFQLVKLLAFFIKNSLLLRGLRAAGMKLREAGPMDAESAAQAELNAVNEVALGALTDKLKLYWTEDSADRATDALNKQNNWLASHPIGYGSYNAYLQENHDSDDIPSSSPNIVPHESYLSSVHRQTLLRRGLDDLYSPDALGHAEFDHDDAPLTHQQSHSAHARTDLSTMPFATNETHYEKHAKPHKNAHHKHHAHHQAKPHHLEGHVHLTDEPLHNDFHKRVRCQSRFCGNTGVPGEEVSLPHPILTIRAGHNYRRHQMGIHTKMTLKQHRNRFVLGAAVLHAAKGALHHTIDRHYHNGNGAIPAAATQALKDITGHESMHSLLEHTMSHHENPADSLASYIPNFSDWPLISMLADADPNKESYFGNYMRERIVFYHDDDHDDRGDNVLRDLETPAKEHLRSGKQRMRLQHVTIDTAKELEDELRNGAFVPYSHATRKLLQFRGEGLTVSQLTGPMHFVSAAAVDTKSARLKDGNKVPSIPTFKLATVSDCVHRPGAKRPRSPLCLPEIPLQVGCVVGKLANKLFFDVILELNYCTYEPRCGQIGFIIIERPAFRLDLFVIVDHLDLYISWDWLWNGLFWFIMLLAPIAPITKATLRAIGRTGVPFLYLLTEPVAALIPTTIVLNDYICLGIFAYGPVFIIMLIAVGKVVVLPMFLWALRTWVSTEAMISGFLAIEAARLQAIQNTTWWQLQNGVLSADQVLDRRASIPQPPRQGIDDTMDNLPTINELLHPYTGPGSQNVLDTNTYQTRRVTARIGAPLLQDPEAAYTDLPTTANDEDLDQISPDALQAIHLYARTLPQIVAHFPEEELMANDTEDAEDFEWTFKELMVTPHLTSIWLNQWVGQYLHERQASRDRRPPAMPYYNGSVQE